MEICLFFLKADFFLITVSRKEDFCNRNFYIVHNLWFLGTDD